MGGKVKFDYTILAENSSANVQVWSRSDGRNGILAATNVFYFPFLNCFAQGHVTYNSFYGFNPYNSFCDNTLNPRDSWYPMYGLSAHELGHALGLGHSGDAGAVLWDGGFDSCVTKGINGDDEAGIIAIYGRGN